jgi:hypothetical protein
VKDDWEHIPFPGYARGPGARYYGRCGECGKGIAHGSDSAMPDGGGPWFHAACWQQRKARGEPAVCRETWANARDDGGERWDAIHNRHSSPFGERRWRMLGRDLCEALDGALEDEPRHHGGHAQGDCRHGDVGAQGRLPRR